jgi:hypothetical protein
MSSTITRFHLTDDSGTPAAPVGDGTLWGDTHLQQIFDEIDAVLAGHVAIGGTLTVEGFGTHLVSAGGSGGNIVRVRNTSAGTGNYAELQAVNNGGNGAVLRQTSSTFTPSGPFKANGSSLYGNGDGGLSIYSQIAATTIGFYAGNTAETARVACDGASHSLPTVHVAPTSALGARFLASSDAAADAIAVVQAGEPGVSANNVIIGNNYLASSTGASARKNTGVGGFYLRLGRSTLEAVSVDASGVLSGRLSIDSSGHIAPGVDNAQRLGDATHRLSEIHGVAIYSGDIRMENGFTWTEHDHVQIATPGVALLNPAGELVAFFAENGDLYCGRRRSLKELETTQGRVDLPARERDR